MILHIIPKAIPHIVQGGTSFLYTKSTLPPAHKYAGFLINQKRAVRPHLILYQFLKLFSLPVQNQRGIARIGVNIIIDRIGILHQQIAGIIFPVDFPEELL